MTIKGFFKALGKAAVWFAIYYVWQILVINWASIGASFYVGVNADQYVDMSQLESDLEAGVIDEDSFTALYTELNDELYDVIYDIIMKYSVHLTLASGVLTLITYYVIFRMRKKNLLREACVTKLPLRQVPVLLLLGAALNVFISTVMEIIPFPQSWIDAYIESSSVLVESGAVITFITSVIAAPIVEEVVFRGLCYTRLKRGMPMLAAMLICAWGFGLMHGTAIWFLYASVVGLLLAWVFEKYRSLTASILVHFSFNLCGDLLSYITEVNDAAFWLMMAAGGLVSLALIAYIVKTSPNKIEIGLPEQQEETT
ncbi:MAG: CPBP family intramembrane metalloprotease [Clostridia bacterium]|nr:CPBP family intramembrane metalloprotease [Clostridia bacterium]